MIKKFENFSDDSLNKEVIDSASVIDFTAPNGDTYQHILQFVLPYHENDLIDTKKYYKGVYDMIEQKFKFTKFENDFGSLGKGLVKRTIVTSAIVYDGKLYRNSEYDLGTFWSKSKRENKPLYILKFVSIKNGNKAYSQEGLDKIKEMYPDLLYKFN
jgi:hypothetical protein